MLASNTLSTLTTQIKGFERTITTKIIRPMFPYRSLPIRI